MSTSFEKASYPSVAALARERERPDDVLSYEQRDTTKNNGRRTFSVRSHAFRAVSDSAHFIKGEADLSFWLFGFSAESIIAT